jgi:hypothetical protein
MALPNALARPTRPRSRVAVAVGADLHDLGRDRIDVDVDLRAVVHDDLRLVASLVDAEDEFLVDQLRELARDGFGAQPFFLRLGGADNLLVGGSRNGGRTRPRIAALPGALPHGLLLSAVNAELAAAVTAPAPIVPQPIQRG